MSLIDRLLGLLAPYECLGCGNEGALLCINCRLRLKQPPEQCYRCRQLSAGYLTCSQCSRSSALQQVRAATIYGGIAKQLIWRLKSAGARSAAAVMAESMAPLLAVQENTVIVPVPTATSRIRRRGYDQAALLARELSRRTRLPVVRCLTRQSHADQIGASQTQRRQQLQGAFRVKRSQLVKETHILLIDDVVTTGSTLEAAANVLCEAGARSIAAVTFAQPLKIK